MPTIVPIDAVPAAMHEELLDAVKGHLQVVAYEHGVIDDPRPAVVQRICAVRRNAGETAIN